jgi:hypothetical protein
LKFENVLHHMKIQHQKTKEHSLWPLHHWKTITFFRYPKHISVKFTVAVFIMDYGNSIFSWFNIRKLKTCIFSCYVIIVLDANFKNLPGKPFSIQKIAQAITPVLLLIFWILYLWKSVLSEQNRLRAAILNLEPKYSREDFRENRAFQSAFYFEKKLVKNSIYHFVVTRAESCCFGFNKNICSLYWWFSVSFIDKLSISSSYFIICNNFISVEF